MMRAFSTPLLAALLVAAAVAPAAAAPAPKAKAAAAPPSAAAANPVTSDVRCLLTMAALGQDKERQQAAIIGAYFFAGRLSVRAPGLDIPGAVKAQEQAMTPKELPIEAQRCGPLVQAAVRSLQQTFAPPAAAQPGAQPGAQAAPKPAPAPAAPAPAAPPIITTPK